MNFFRVGVVDFFGILCPGILVSINLYVLLLACNVRVDQIWKFISKGDWGVMIFILLFVICYLFGFILRLITPDYVDKTATFFGKLTTPWQYSKKFKLHKQFKDEEDYNELSRKERRNKFRVFLDGFYEESVQKGNRLPKFFWNDECYPYYYGIKYIYYRDLPHKIARGIMAQNKYHNKSSLNFWKTLLMSRDPNLATLVSQAEALVRFMAGSFWALVIGIISGILLVINNLGSSKAINISISLTAISILMAVIILKRFKNQRRREVKILVDAIYVISKVDKEVKLLSKKFSE